MLGCCLRLKEALNSLSPREKQIAIFIMEFPAEVVKMSIEELATACDTSSSAVVRLCKAANYSGYKELLRTLSADLATEQIKSVTYSDIRPGDSVDTIIHSVCMSNMESIKNTLSVLDADEMQKAVDAIVKAPRVDFYGAGTSGIIALDACNKFIRVNKLSMSSNDPHQQILSASQLKKDDVAVLISYTGDTKDILETAGIIKQTPATLISLTRFSKNELSQKADIRLFCSSSETLIRSGPMGSRIGLLTVIDVLYTSVASAIYDEAKPYLDKTRMVSARKHLHYSQI